MQVFSTVKERRWRECNGNRQCESKIGTEHGDNLKKTTANLFITFK